ncbi:aquaporin-like protein [Decorospora gaudefroyi]|uniref:Aquaporin-like protein n=1 Tax=Decorospora gaudefroyi TaxID=184978 RepID=A0A6A5JWK3_9PLEO|nr:aquaporin-like protein [Decorospora gaudefroyi]
MSVKDHEADLPSYRASAEHHSEDRRRHHNIRTEITAFLGELIGTFMFLSLAFSRTQIALNATNTNNLTASANSMPNVKKLLYISFTFGVSLAINVGIFADVSGGKFNPAVSLAKKKLCTRNPRPAIVAQLLASMAAAGFVLALLPGPLTIETKLDASISITRGLFLEAFVTSQLVLTILITLRNKQIKQI